MDDPTWSWPFWKFGLKRDDLSTTLQEQYNTVSFSLQDPEAFHHDVCEIARDAQTSNDFHRLMADRRQQRLAELNESLESLAVEIIANPELMATEQWSLALQLFRTKSFDSIVRYFASYLPEGGLERPTPRSSFTTMSDCDSIRTASTKASTVDDAQCPIYLDDDDEDVVFTSKSKLSDESGQDFLLVDDTDEVRVAPMFSEEPCSYVMTPAQTIREETAATEAESLGYTGSVPPSRATSYLSFETNFKEKISYAPYLISDDQTSISECDSASTPASDSIETRSSLDSLEDQESLAHSIEYEDEEFPPAQYPDDEVMFAKGHGGTVIDLTESDTPTPRQSDPSSYFHHTKYDAALSRRKSCLRRLSALKTSTISSSDENSSNRRRSPEEIHSKIHKPLSDANRKRPKGRV